MILTLATVVVVESLTSVLAMRDAMADVSQSQKFTPTLRVAAQVMQIATTHQTLSVMPHAMTTTPFHATSTRAEITMVEAPDTIGEDRSDRQEIEFSFDAMLLRNLS